MPYTGQRKQQRGFTVAEVLMVILLLAAVLSLVIVNFFSFEGAFAKRPVVDQIRLAVAEAHWLARTQKKNILYAYSEPEEAIELREETGKLLRSFNFPKGSGTNVKLYRVAPESQFSDDLSYDSEETSVDYIRFHPYGSSSPFIVELDQAQALVELRFDPFSAMNWRESDAI